MPSTTRQPKEMKRASIRLHSMLLLSSEAHLVNPRSSSLLEEGRAGPDHRARASSRRERDTAERRRQTTLVHYAPPHLRSRPSNLSTSMMIGAQHQPTVRERPPPGPEDQLGLTRFGLRFAAPETESAFHAFHALSSLNAFRIGVLGSLVAWCVGTTVAARIFPAYSKQYYVAGWVIMAPLLLLAFRLSQRSSWLSRLAWWSGGLNILAGVLLTLVMDFDDYVLRGVGLGLIILVAFFSFTIFRLRLLPSLAAVLVYYLMFQARLTNHFLNAAMDSIEHAGYSFVLWITFAVGAFVVVNLERG